MPWTEFEPAIPGVRRLQTYALDRTDTGMGHFVDNCLFWKTPVVGYSLTLELLLLSLLGKQ
jgi:hypothetical protein